MDFDKLMNVASKNERKAQKELTSSKPALSTKLAPPRKEVKSTKGIQSATVRAFLERREKEEKDKAEVERRKKDELLKLRHEARHDRKAHAMASRTKDNLKVFSGAESKDETQEDPVVDLKHLFTKHDRRVPHLPSDKIPDMLSVIKERQKQRHMAQEAAKSAAVEAETARFAQLKHCSETTESESKRKKLMIAPPRTASDEKPSTSRPAVTKSSPVEKSAKSKDKVVRKNHRPPMSFEQLMNLAQQKQAEPVIDTAPCDDVPKKACTEQHRPMTQEEKERQQRRETKEYQHWLKYGGAPPPAVTGGKPRHRQHVGESHKGQRESHRGQTVISVSLSESDESDASDGATDEVNYVLAQDVNTEKSSSHGTVNRLKDNRDIPRRHSPSTEAGSRKLLNSKSSHQAVEHSKPVSHKEVLARKGNEPGQNGKSKSPSDELIEKLKEERRRMADRGDALPSLADMLQDLLNKVRGESNLHDTSPIHSLLPEAKPAKPSSGSSMSKISTSEHRVEAVKSVPGGSRSKSRPSSQYVAVHETVVDCSRKPSHSTKPVQSSNQRRTKSTWEEMNERAKSKYRGHDRVRLSEKRPVESDESSASEEENDEMDDFIDDGSDVEPTDYSHYIRQLFGYDRRKYVNEKDDDLHGMESSYSQQLKEDAISTKLGLLEDLEDMRKEEEEKLRELGKLKAKKPRLK